MRRRHMATPAIGGLLAFALTLGAGSLHGSGAADFPQKSKSVTMIIGTSAGGSTDAGARILASIIEKEWPGIRIQIENKPGAGWQIGLTALARARTDGYTIGFAVLPQAITNYLDPQRKAVFTRKSFQPLAMQVVDPGVIAVKAGSPYRSLKDLVDAAKANPERIRATSTGILSDDHLAILQFEKLTGTRLATVQFDGSAPMMTALLGGHTDVYFGNIGDAFTQFRVGEVRILGIMDREENKILPGAKTTFSQGIPLESSSSRGLYAPAGVPKDIVEAWAAVIKKAMADPEHVKRMDEQGLTIRYMDPATVEKYWTDMEERIKPLMAAAKEK